MIRYIQRLKDGKAQTLLTLDAAATRFDMSSNVMRSALTQKTPENIKGDDYWLLPDIEDAIHKRDAA